MVEAGADQVPEATLLEALDLAQREIVKICEAQEELRAKAGKPKWLDAAVTERLEAAHGEEIAAAHRPRRARRRRARVVDEILAREAGAADDAARPRSDVVRELQTRSSLAAILEQQARSPRSRRPVREQFEDDLRGAHRGRAGLQGAQVGQAAPALRPHRRDGRAAVPDRARGRRAGTRDALTRQYVAQGGRVALQGARAAQDRGRQAPARRPLRAGDPRGQLRGVGQPAHARLGALHPRPDADHVAAHARHRQGGPADRRPLAREGPPLHPPLQLPALLGRGDGADDRPAPARHRPRRARPAGARGGDPVRGRLPVHDPDRLRDARVERLLVDGLGLRLDARADGRRRADHARPSRASRWASSRRATTTSSSPTSRAPRTTSATWTSRSPAPRPGSRRCRWTSRSRASRARSWSRRSRRPARRARRSSSGC